MRPSSSIEATRRLSAQLSFGRTGAFAPESVPVVKRSLVHAECEPSRSVVSSRTVPRPCRQPVTLLRDGDGPSFFLALVGRRALLALAYRSSETTDGMILFYTPELIQKLDHILRDLDR